MKKIYTASSIALLLAITFYGVNTFKKSADAYLYGYPLVLMEATRANMETLSPNAAGSNHLHHLRELPTHEFRSVVRPNNDTLYSIVWFDLSKEPQIISTPNMGENYYVLPFMDAWTNVFSTVGTRTTGNDKKQFALVGPDWNGALPEQLERIDAPTNMVWMIGRTEVKDLKNPQVVFDLQDQFKVTGLTDWHQDSWRTGPLNNEPLSSPEGHQSPPDEVAALTAEQFFNRLSLLLTQQRPAEGDLVALQNLSSLGVEAGEKLDINPFQQWIMNKAVKVAHQKLSDIASQRQPNENNWFVIRDGIGRYEQDYKTRAFVAMFGLGALPPEEASYPSTHNDSTQQILDGKHRYRIQWQQAQLPPVGAFWSLTIYDEAGYMIENAINRYRIGSNNELNWNADGSLKLQL